MISMERARQPWACPGHPRLGHEKKDVDARDKRGHDDGESAGLYRTSTFLNCQGSDVSMSSGNSPGRSVSGVQSV